MAYYITQKKTQTLTFDLSDDFTGEILTFNLLNGDETLYTGTLVATDITTGKFTLTVASANVDYDVGEYTYDITSNIEGEIDSGYAYIIEDEETRVEFIKGKYGFNFSEDILRIALKQANKNIIKYLFSDGDKKLYHTDTNNQIKIDNYVADNKFYGFVSRENMRVYQYMTHYPYTVQELNDKITNINFDLPIGSSVITFDDQYPTSGYSMKVEYKKIIKPYDDVIDVIKYIQELYVYLYLLDTVEINKMQLGFTSRSINNVTFDFNKESVDDLKIKIRQWIDNEANEFEEILINDVNISNDY